jgi:proteasome lid subunit RPN8/RPN11
MRKSHRISGKGLRDEIRNAVAAAGNGGRGICGLLLDNGQFYELVEVKNCVTRGGGFRFDKSDIRTVLTASKKLRHEVVGTYHSHPAYIAQPSESDTHNAVDGSLMLVIDVLEREAMLWRVSRRGKRRLRFELL